jgi:hypothetical protein
MLVIYEDNAQAKISWDWIDVPFFVCMAAVVGTCAAMFTKVLVFVWTTRRRIHNRLKNFQPYAKIAEVAIYICICSTVFIFLPLAFDCEDTGATASHRRLGGAAGVVYRQYDCPTGHDHNVVASLMLNGGEGAVKHLYSRSADAFQIGPLVASLIAYGILAMGMPGLAVPMGNFIPSMVIGSLFGRILGELLQKTDMNVCNAGVYAMVGSAAMLGGFTHMTIAIVCLLVEAGHDIYLTPPLMMSVFVAHFFSKLFLHHGYDEVLIIKKGVPFLEPDAPHELDNPSITPVTLCVQLPDECRLPYHATIEDLKLAYSHRHVHVFPVFREGYLVGTTARSRLRSIMPKNILRDLENAPRDEDDEDEYEDDTAEYEEEDVELHLDEVFADMLGQEKWKHAKSDAKGFLKLIMGNQKELIKEMFHEWKLFVRMQKAERTGSAIEAEPEIDSDGESFDRQTSCASSHAPQDTLPLKLIMDPYPFEIVEDMPATKVYSLFSQGVVNVACVVSKTGDFIGTLNRSAFTEQHIHDVLSKGPPASSGEEQDGIAKKIEQDGIVEGKAESNPKMKQFVERVRGGQPKDEVLHEILMTQIGKEKEKSGKEAFDIDDIAIQLKTDVEDFTKQLQSEGDDNKEVMTV